MIDEDTRPFHWSRAESIWQEGQPKRGPRCDAWLLTVRPSGVCVRAATAQCIIFAELRNPLNDSIPGEVVRRNEALDKSP